MAKAKYYLMTCKPVSGEEAERIGLVSMCVEDDELQKIALDTAVELANGSQSAIRWTKYSLNNWLRQAGPIFDASTALEMLGFVSEDVKEGVLSHRSAKSVRRTSVRTARFNKRMVKETWSWLKTSTWI